MVEGFSSGFSERGHTMLLQRVRFHRMVSCWSQWRWYSLTGGREGASQTIFAPCTVGNLSAERSWDMTSYPQSAVCVIRISGPDALPVLRDVTRDARTFRPNSMYIRSLYRPSSASDPTTLIDHNAMVVYFQGPRSFTGEDVVELHVHGGRAILRDIMDSLMEFGSHLRPAEPGEFTKRAFLNGKMDLTQVEGLSDVLSSQTKAQKDMALAQVMGMGRDILNRWRKTLVSCIASVEAVIDFGEDDIEPEDVQRVLLDSQRHAEHLQREIQSHIDAAPKSEIVKEGVRVVLVGPPNVGKSSLLNTMVGRSAAIVSPRAGTTRDIVEATLDIGGHKVIIQDGAGIRSSEELEEAEGITRILAAAEKAHILLVVSAVDQPNAPLDEKLTHIINHAPRVLYVSNKDDLIQGNLTLREDWIRISCHSGKGVNTLINALKQHLLETTRPSSIGETIPPVLYRARHLHHMRNAVRALQRFHETAALELAAEELRIAVTELGYVTGIVDIEDILDSIFNEFCIGK